MYSGWGVDSVGIIKLRVFPATDPVGTVSCRKQIWRRVAGPQPLLTELESSHSSLKPSSTSRTSVLMRSSARNSTLELKWTVGALPALRFLLIVWLDLSRSWSPVLDARVCVLLASFILFSLSCPYFQPMPYTLHYWPTIVALRSLHILYPSLLDISPYSPDAHIGPMRLSGFPLPASHIYLSSFGFFVVSPIDRSLTCTIGLVDHLDSRPHRNPVWS